MNIEDFINIDDFDSQRTIVDIFDSETGEQMDADELLDGNEEGLNMQIRSGLVLAQKSGIYKYCCSYCNQPLSLTRRRLPQGGYSIYYFTHFKDSEDCPIKTVNDQGNPYGWAKKVYLGRKGGKLHQDMQRKLMHVLERDIHFSDSKEFKTIKDKTIIDEWRRPDIATSYKGKPIIFEFQLCSTFINGILDRTSFYKIVSMNLIWIFPKFDKNDQELCEKDTFYSHKRNVFVFDSVEYYKNDGIDLPFNGYRCAYEESIRQGKLMINVWWQTPSIVLGNVHITWHHKLISFAELTIDDSTNDVYYHDSDADFYNIANLEEKRIIDEWEQVKKERWDKIWNNVRSRQEKYEKEKTLSQEAIRVRTLLRELHSGYRSLEPYQDKNELWGYKIEDIIVVRPRYTQITDFKGDIAWVKMATWGAINSLGKKVVNFQYTELSYITDYILKVRNKDYRRSYSLIRHDGSIICSGFDELRFVESLQLILACRGYWGIIDLEGNKLVDYLYSSIEPMENGSFKIGRTSIMDCNFKILPDETIKYENCTWGKALGKWGLINDEGEWISKRKYKKITPLVKNLFLFEVEYDYIGVVDSIGKEIISEIKDYSIDVLDGRYLLVVKKTYWEKEKGLYNLEGEKILDLKYNDIIPVGDKYLKVKVKNKNNSNKELIGVYCNNGQCIIPTSYQNVTINSQNEFIAYINDNSIDKYTSEGVFIPQEKIEISESLYATKKQNYWGVCNNNGDIIIPFIFYKYEGHYKGLIILGIVSKIGYSNEHKAYHLKYYNFKGEEIYPDQVELYGYSSLFKIRNENGWGVINDTKEILINPSCSFKSICRLSDKYLLAGNDIYDIQERSEIKKVYNSQLYDNENLLIKDSERGWREYNYYYLLLNFNDLNERRLNKISASYTYVGDGYFLNQNNNYYSNDIYIYSVEGVKLFSFTSRGNTCIDYLGDSVFKIHDNYYQISNKTNTKEIANNDNSIANDKFKITSKTFNVRTIRYGVIDNNGNELIPFIYNQITQKNCFIVAREGKKYSTFKWNGLSFVASDYVPGDVYGDKSARIVVASIWGKYYLFGQDGQKITTESFLSIKLWQDKYLNVKNSNGSGLITFDAKYVLSCEYEDISLLIDEIFCVKKQGKYGLCTNNDSIIYPIVLDEVGNVIHDKIVIKKENKYGCIDIEGNTIVECLYEDLEPFVNGVAKFKDANKYGLIAISGEILLPPTFDNLEIKDNLYLLGVLNGQNSLLDRRGNILVPLGKYEIESVAENCAILKIRHNGYIYEEIYDFNNGLKKHILTLQNARWYKTKLFNLYGLLDNDFNVVIDNQYTSLEWVNESLYIISIEGLRRDLYGVINVENNEVLIECKYANIIHYKDERFFVQSLQNNLWGYCDLGHQPCDIKYSSPDFVLKALENPISNAPISRVESSSIDMNLNYLGIVTGKAPFGLFVKVNTIGKGIIKTNHLKKMGFKVHDFKKGQKIRVKIHSVDNDTKKIVFKLTQLL